MFALLNPAALLALLGLMVPVAIHLWNRRPGREVAVGSLRWLAAGANRRLRNLQLEHLGLLLLRAALLAVLAVAVAGPVWRRALPAGRGQVLLSPEVLSNPALGSLRPGIDSLRARGYGLRWLAAGFPKMSGAAWRANAVGPRDSARLLSVGSRAAGFGWVRVQQAAAAFAGQPLYVLTPATLAGLQGAHPPLRAGITWQTLPGATPATWVQEIDARGDSLHVLIGRSTETQTTFSRKAAARPKPSQLLRVAGVLPMRLQPGPDSTSKLVAAAPDTATKTAPAVEVAPPLTALIYTTPAFAQDARYLRAAIRAAAAGLASSPVIELTDTPPTDARAQWLFWLSEEPLPAKWRTAVQRGSQVWQEASGPGVPDEARLVPLAAAETPASIIRRGGEPAAPGSIPVWVDGQGRAVLSRRTFGAGAFYRLHTRLDPTWSTLADNPALPGRLLALLHPAAADGTGLAPDNPALAAQDKRIIDLAQLPVRQSDRPNSKAATTKNYQADDLRPWLVLAVGLLFALERLLASRREHKSLISTP
ncbi:BatA domain-containing protein [Hymenobacter convexus]|uniref:BatA domain-containing protein n=1 Tax=Hymenobacter sp. CA1UV-4 TaxID=3063782 RepID=UPI0027136559|nr:BatA domain-containing protein [Hymenobacter sp. CA1UV-4]MDO7853302.1 BatA domain-containing protein [Hymenobacter sp. CA1UV-4]